MLRGRRSEITQKKETDEEKKWVTVFGYTLANSNLVLCEVERCGTIVKHIPSPRDANWLHFFQGIYDTPKALEKNGTLLNSMLIVGVKYVYRMHLQFIKENSKKINHGEFMVSLPWNSAASNTAADPNSSRSPTSKLLPRMVVGTLEELLHQQTRLYPEYVLIFGI